jgi:hypothetical protein
MSELNDDMDELFRRAAENYPLKTDSDWSKLNHALQAADDVSATDTNETKKENYRKLLWLLLLLLIPLVYYIHTTNKAINTNTAKKNKTTSNVNSVQNSQKTAAVSNHLSNQVKTNTGNPAQKNQLIPAGNEMSGNTANGKNTGLQKSTTASPKNIVTRIPNNRPPAINRRDKEINDPLKIIKNSPAPLNSNSLVHNANSTNNSPASNTNIPSGNTANTPLGNISQPGTNNGQQGNNIFPVATGQSKSTDIQNKKTTVSQDKKNIASADSNKSADNKNVMTTSAGKKKATEKKEKTARLYAGILAGIDISTIKFQSVKTAGYNLGILLGYQLNKKLAIETGAIWDKKFYYSDGKYFNTSKIYLPANSVIDDVDGNCAMIELPINIKYNFKSSGRTTWFSLIGFSSYLMKKENYDYTLENGGVYTNGSRTYTNSSTNWLSVMNLSVGYSHTFGKRKTSALRIEPYFKIPLKGMGIGSLPITSSGINIGFTKTIF